MLRLRKGTVLAVNNNDFSQLSSSEVLRIMSVDSHSRRGLQRGGNRCILLYRMKFSR